MGWKFQGTLKSSPCFTTKYIFMYFVSINAFIIIIIIIIILFWVDNLQSHVYIYTCMHIYIYITILITKIKIANYSSYKVKNNWETYK